MRKRIFYPILIFFLLVITGVFSFAYQKLHKPEIVHYHAGFQVYIDGKQKDFSVAQYMHEKPCTQNESNEDLNDPMEKAHLHDFIGDVVHVHRTNVVWGDLFKNLKFTPDPNKPMTAYVNGRQVDHIMNYPIKSYDSLVLFIGNVKDPKPYLAKAVTVAHIKSIEKMSESCGSGS